MTLVVLEIHVPAHDAFHNETEFWHGLTTLGPQFLMYLMSFLTLGIFWTGQQTQLNHLARADRDFTWIHFAFLAAISVLPFSTTLLAEFITFRSALLIYWVNILALGLLLYASWAYAKRAGLVRDDAPEHLHAAIRKRIIVAQCLYAIGAALCIFNTYWSIIFIVLVQLNYAIAPRFLNRIG